MEDDQQQQTTEVRETNTQVGDTNIQRQTVAKSTKTSGVVVLQRVIWFFVGVITALLALRFVLLLLAANRDAGFVDFIYTVSSLFVAPFVGIFGEPAYGESVLEVSSLLAIAVYALVGWGLAKLVTLSRPHEEV